MPDSILERTPVVGGHAYVERVGRLPGSFTATLVAEPDNRYFPHAVAVLVNGEKVGYLAPEISRGCYEAIRASTVTLTCPGRRARHSDHEWSGIEMLLNLAPIAAQIGAM
jgi:hypothetical protein